jgi:regulator of protease activity HflC (stomatin/prohibitin superfamily)
MAARVVASAEQSPLADVEVAIQAALDAPIGSLTLEQIVRDCKMIPAETIEQALALASHKLGWGLRVLIVPHTLQTLIRMVAQP